jgi:opacity protein-like surface antigen
MRKIIAFCIGLSFSTIPFVHASENIPAKPFAQAVWLPEAHEWWVTPWYQYTEFEKIWRGSRKENITVGGGHGFDQNDGMLLVEYGIAKNWAADLTVGYTSLATRSFTSPPGTVATTTGYRDITVGLRWQLLNETNTSCKYVPTLTLRAGGIYNGGYDENFPFAPGNGSVGIEPSVLVSKRFGWEGFGMYGNLGFRDMRSGGNSQVFGSVGIFQDYKGFNFDGGYRQQQNTAGVDIGGSDNTIVYSTNVKEYNQLYEVGFGYTNKKRQHFQFYLSQNFNGKNTGDKTIYGIYATLPFGP